MPVQTQAGFYIHVHKHTDTLVFAPDTQQYYGHFKDFKPGCQQMFLGFAEMLWFVLGGQDS